MTYVQEVLADSPSGFWPLNETSGTVAADASGNGHDGTYVRVQLGQPTLLADGSGASARFPGADGSTTAGYVDIPHAAWMDQASFTIEALVNAEKQTGNLVIASRDTAQADYTARTWLLRSSDGVLNGGMWNPSHNHDEVNLDSSARLTTGTFRHVVMTYSDGSLKGYIDGVFASSVDTYSNPPNTTGRPLRIGYLDNVQYDVWNWLGLIQGVAFYPVALSATRIKAHSDAARAGFSTVVSTPTATATASAASPTVSGVPAPDFAANFSDGLVPAQAAPWAYDAQGTGASGVIEVAAGSNISASVVAGATVPAKTLLLRAQSPSTTAYIQLTLTYNTAGSINFEDSKWAETFDHGNFYIDGVFQHGGGPNWDWTARSYAVAAGQHTFRWEFTHDSSVNSAPDSYGIASITAPGTGGSPAVTVIAPVATASAAATQPTVTTQTAYDSAVMTDAPGVYYPTDVWQSPGLLDASGNGRDLNVVSNTAPTFETSVGTPPPSRNDVRWGSARGQLRTTQQLSAHPPINTYEAWVKVTTLPAANLTLMTWAPTTGYYGDTTHIFLTPSGQIGLSIYNGSSSTVTTPSAVSAGWHHVAASIGAAGAFLYVDGSQVASGPQTSAQSFVGCSFRLHGAYNGVDEVDDAGGDVSLSNPAWYPTQLSAARILAHYNAVVGSATTIQPPTATASATAAAPTPSIGVRVTPPTATASAAAAQPSVLASTSITVPTATASAAAGAPTVLTTDPNAAPTAQATASGQAPTLGVAVPSPVATGEGQALAPTTKLAIIPPAATATAAASAPSTRTVLAVPMATATAAAAAPTAAVTLLTGLATEADAPQSVTALQNGPVPIAQVIETDEARPIASRTNLQTSIETETAQPVVVVSRATAYPVTFTLVDDKVATFSATQPKSDLDGSIREGSYATHNGRYWTFTAPRNGFLTLDTFQSLPLNQPDTTMSLFDVTVSSTSWSVPAPIAENDDDYADGGGARSRVTFSLVAGHKYLVVTSTYSQDDSLTDYVLSASLITGRPVRRNVPYAMNYYASSFAQPYISPDKLTPGDVVVVVVMGESYVTGFPQGWTLMPGTFQANAWISGAVFARTITDANDANQYFPYFALAASSDGVIFTTVYTNTNLGDLSVLEVQQQVTSGDPATNSLPAGTVDSVTVPGPGNALHYAAERFVHQDYGTPVNNPALTGENLDGGAQDNGAMNATNNATIGAYYWTDREDGSTSGTPRVYGMQDRLGHYLVSLGLHDTVALAPVPVGQAVEEDLGRRMGPEIDRNLRTPVENDIAQPVLALQSLVAPVGQAVESDSTRVVSGHLLAQVSSVGQAVESSFAFPVSPTGRVALLEQAIEDSQAFAVRTGASPVAFTALTQIGVAQSNGGSTSISPTLFLNIYDPVVEQGPTSITVAVTGGYPNEPVNFFIDGDYSAVQVTTDGGTTGAVTLSVDSEHAQVGVHTVTAQQFSAMATADFQILHEPDMLPTTDRGLDALPVFIPSSQHPSGVRRWVLQDLTPGGLGSYVMPLNPVEMDNPAFERILTVHRSTAINGSWHINESRTQPKQWSFKGYCPTQEMADTLRAYSELNRRFYIVDHRGRAWMVAPLSCDLQPRLRATNIYGDVSDSIFDYTFQTVVLDQDPVQL